jgi:hypothetical protein
VAPVGILSESQNKETFGGNSFLYLKFLAKFYIDYLPMEQE